MASAKTKAKREAKKKKILPMPEDAPIVLKEGDYPLIASGQNYLEPIKAQTLLYQKSGYFDITGAAWGIFDSFAGQYIAVTHIRLYEIGASECQIGDETGALLYFATSQADITLQKPYYFKGNIRIFKIVAAGTRTYYLDIQGEVMPSGFVP